MHAMTAVRQGQTRRLREAIKTRCGGNKVFQETVSSTTMADDDADASEKGIIKDDDDDDS